MSEILHVLDLAGVGGIERLVLDAMRAFAPVDPSVRLVALNATGPLAAELDQLPNVALRLGDEGRSSVLLRLFRSASGLHLHGFTPRLAGLAWASGRPIIYTEHGNFGFGRVRSTKDRLKDQLKGRFLASRAVQVVTHNSQFARTISLGRHPGIEAKSFVVYNGVPALSETLPLSGRQPTIGEMRLGCVGRLAGVKRVDRALEALSLFRRKGLSAQLTLVGDGPDRNRLEAQAQALGLGDSVRFVGVQADPKPWFDGFDALLIPSTGEAFGIVAIEALSRGVPVVAWADGGGVLEILAHLPGDRRWVADDAADAASIVQAIADDPAGYAKAIESALPELRDAFSMRRMINRWRSIYERIAVASGSP